MSGEGVSAPPNLSRRTIISERRRWYPAITQQRAMTHTPSAIAPTQTGTSCMLAATRATATVRPVDNRALVCHEYHLCRSLLRRIAVVTRSAGVSSGRFMASFREVHRHGHGPTSLPDWPSQRFWRGICVSPASCHRCRAISQSTVIQRNARPCSPIPLANPPLRFHRHTRSPGNDGIHPAASTLGRMPAVSPPAMIASNRRGSQTCHECRVGTRRSCRPRRRV